jgi:peptidoglycan/LPS O-acetylase OafA/YrhL
MIHLIIWIALLGLLVYLITTYVPMAQPFKIVIYVIAAIFVILLLMNTLGISDPAIPSLGRGR